jgi:hypothetical protein
MELGQVSYGVFDLGIGIRVRVRVGDGVQQIAGHGSSDGRAAFS